MLLCGVCFEAGYRLYNQKKDRRAKGHDRWPCDENVIHGRCVVVQINTVLYCKNKTDDKGREYHISGGRTVMVVRCHQHLADLL